MDIHAHNYKHQIAGNPRLVISASQVLPQKLDCLSHYVH
uniref:Uncharacterized protein n=1 Tax=Rhizophora mucronata TaxID=61149 RepID=A0A2P2KEF0_RHIMU